MLHVAEAAPSSWGAVAALDSSRGRIVFWPGWQKGGVAWVGGHSQQVQAAAGAVADALLA